MNEATWAELIKNIPANQPVLVSYTLTQDDVKGPFKALPSGAAERSKLKALSYESVEEMLGERFHMSVAYIKKLNPNKRFVAGETITVINTGEPLKEQITRVIADKNDKILYAYNGDKLVATYPTTIGSIATATPSGKFKVINNVKMPTYKATVNRGEENQKHYFLPPGPNSPVGVVWIGLNKPSYGIHGSPVPEGISRQQSLGCIRLTNWDVLEVHANIKNGATVEIR
ncbi:Putative L,D-transpeptidase YkuD [Moraxella caviae]|uniref:L,D-transpeptidase YkuD n=1 Tax=Moraxella caviae TaxID=34060 RepID=A0A378R976_9GAMM|nr:L,D-transpeptidase [Moraxella caviae]STZ14654.1 Putative L,D-transpeptidase YkuD [Moraxella caviae]VEW13326.1 Putative L,D-transpeptidase YkuD [Moraxella caviae]